MGSRAGHSGPDQGDRAAFRQVAADGRIHQKCRPPDLTPEEVD